jgi:predicted nucleic acid-binding protein
LITKDDQEVIRVYGELMQWAVKQVQFSQAAKDEFARVENADAWIIAYARVHNYVIVTQEVLDLNIKKKIPIPNVCDQFDVKHIDTFKMLRELNFKFK